MSNFRSLLWSGALCAVLVGCGEENAPDQQQRNLNTPIDIAFACYGGLRITNGGASDPTQAVVTSAMPTTACDLRSTVIEVDGVDVPVVPPGQADESTTGGTFVPIVDWYGLILEAVPGTVAIAKFATTPSTLFTGAVTLLDTDPLSPGSNNVSVGEDPVAIATDRAGCFALTANAGSCDLSALDITSAIDTKDPAVRVDRLAVKNAMGTPIRSKPAAMVGTPSETLIGNACPAMPTGIVYIAYPSCHAVVAVEVVEGAGMVREGIVRGGIQYDAAGVPTILAGAALANLSCPDECAGEAATPDWRPTTIDLFADERVSSTRLAIGLEDGASVTVVDLNVGMLPTTVSQVAFEDPAGKLGVTSVALSPVIGMGGAGGTIDENGSGGEFQFVYAVATDKTVRVASVGTAAGVMRECETQFDSRAGRKIRSAATLSCVPLNDPTAPRRAGARGPGIAIPGDAAPLSVTFIRSPEVEADARPNGAPDKLVGYFAVISATNGAAFMVNVDDDAFPDLFDESAPLAAPVELVAAHQIRDAVGQRGALITDVPNPLPTDYVPPGCDFTGPVNASALAVGGPHALGVPARNVPAGSLAVEKIPQLPGIRQVKCDRNDEQLAVSELSFAAPVEVRDLEFPDLGALFFDENWSLVWEGVLSNDTTNVHIDGPVVRRGMAFSDSAGIRLVDEGKPFCDAGVEPFDVVTMRGCDPTAFDPDTGIFLNCPAGYGCFVHPQSQIAGLGTCMLSSEGDRLTEACGEYMNTLRRYTVATTTTGELRLLPRRHELRTTPVDGCVSNEQCEALADYAIRAPNSLHPSADNTGPDPRTWTCELDPNRRPLAGTGKRCELRCDQDADCITGTVCSGAVAGQAKSGFCMEGVIPPQSCINAPQRYDLRAGDAFTVLGSRSGFVHPITANASGQCIKDPAASRLSIGRLPLTPPACDPTADPLTGQLPAGGFEPNPCSLTTANTDVKPRYVAGTCSLEDVNPSELVERQAPALKFRSRGMNLTITDPYYPGDATCIADRGGTLGKIPHIVPGFSLTFRQSAGRGVLALPLVPAPTFPIKVVHGPTSTIWVLDQGDFLATQIGQSSLRGRVYRVESSALLKVSILN